MPSRATARTEAGRPPGSHGGRLQRVEQQPAAVHGGLQGGRHRCGDSVEAGGPVAEHLGAKYLDTGAMYRVATLWVLRQGIDPADEEAVAKAEKMAAEA